MTWAEIIDGRALADKLNRAVREEVGQLRKLSRLAPGLAMVLVGDHEASNVYVRTKERMCDEVGIRSLMHRLPADVREEDLLTLIRGLNLDVNVNGILVQLPLPAQIRAEAVLTAIDPNKDVDGFHVINAGRLVTGDPRAMVPCTPFGCMRLIGSVREDLTGLKAVVLGRSNIVGKPMAQLLLAANCTVTIAHSRSRDLATECRSAHILVAAVGRPAMVKGDWIKPGAIVIDVGISRLEMPGGKTKLVGDVDYEEARTVAGAITPVPGGVGPMTVASLMRNTVIAACRQRKLEQPDF
ncbi:MAG TPA: bifunctional methylenetetrahydrofolate dehydrogenase/methenyltetrahydrofolate cyclohydrolase FolD [Rhodospirillales bacterium]|nr:bifunctional methylenetetrahydrofolate dehydrogenase/methenyltetrahydrofolate cyclohydrolase FolD [Rhodospirillales bacterium]